MNPNEPQGDLYTTPTPEAPPKYKLDNDGHYIVRPPLIERLLSPQSLQWMMSVGGGMLVTGFVVWLWSTGLFDNPVIAAWVMGGAIAALIVAGIAIVKLTRYQLAGTGLTLLGAMAMPLQLWFYHAQGLINLNEGGHLWIPAAAFCLVYALIARVLRNSSFVYTFIGGVVATGMLFLADSSINQFWNLLPQVTFLVGLGWICVFAEKWFVESDSDFSRSKFGQPFLRAGTVTLLNGLSLLFLSQVAGIFFNEIEFNRYTFVQYAPSLMQQCWAVGLLSLTALGVAFGTPNQEKGVLSKSNKSHNLCGLGVWISICLFAMLNFTVTAGTMTLVSAVAVVGLLMILSSQSIKTALQNQERNASQSIARANTGRVLVICANVVAILFAMNRVFLNEPTLILTLVIGLQIVAAVTANLFSKSDGWKNGFIASAILLTVTGGLIINGIVPFTLITKLEFGTVLVGLVLLTIGHVSWVNEEKSSQGKSSQGTVSTSLWKRSLLSAGLWWGSLLTAAPLLTALFYYRYMDVIDVNRIAQFGHEIAVVASLLSLVAAGIMCRIRSTTIVGTTGLIVYLVSLLTMIPVPEKLQSISVIMMIGGAIFFTTAILLSVYRDRIIAIPQRFRQGEGVFQVLKWR